MSAICLVQAGKDCRFHRQLSCHLKLIELREALQHCLRSLPHVQIAQPIPAQRYDNCLITKKILPTSTQNQDPT